MLGAIFERFDEGFDTADLREAKFCWRCLGAS